MSLQLQHQILAALERIKKLEDAKTDHEERLVVVEKKQKESLLSRTLGLNKNG
jgi:hypothetical protein